jgi:hypothetical protein
MTRRVIVSHRLPELRSGNAEIDHWVAEHLQAHVSQVFEQLTYLIGETETFTASIRGSGTAGTYEIASQRSHYYRTGDLVTAFIDISMAGALTAGGTGDFQIQGLPLLKLDAHFPKGTAFLDGVNWAAGANLTSSFTSETGELGTLIIRETNDNAASTIVPVSGIAANDRIAITIQYITCGVRNA